MFAALAGDRHVPNAMPNPDPPIPRWPHRLAWLLACGTFPLIWMGGLVTTYGAGMAVPDWPNTFGYNLFLYPLESWLAVADVFLEHTHRLIAASVGVLTIVLAVTLRLCDRRTWLRWLGVAAVAGVVFQGVLGGLRVLGNEVSLAKVHGCTAPVFFALCAALVAFTSPRWDRPLQDGPSRPSRRFHVLALLVVLGIYLQIVLGANLRHLEPQSATGWFRLWVWLHLIAAGLVFAGAFALWGAARRLGGRPIWFRRARLLAGLLVIQLLLGAATWLTRYGVPLWFADYIWAVPYTVVAKSPLQAVVVTAHVAVGSLSLVTALSARLWSGRMSADEASGLA